MVVRLPDPEQRERASNQAEATPGAAISAEQLFQSVEYQETFQARARARFQVAGALLKTSIGQKIMARLLPGLQEKERKRQDVRLDAIVLAYEKTGLIAIPEGVATADHLKQVALAEPDLQPIHPTLAGLEGTYHSDKILDLNQYLVLNQYEAIKSTDFRIERPPIVFEPGMGEDQAQAAVRLIDEMVQFMAGAQIHRALRERLLQLAARQEWPIFIDTLFALHNFPATSAALAKIASVLGPKLFQNPNFRRQLFFVLVKHICILDFGGFESFAEFFLQLGFTPYNDQEKAENFSSSPQFLENNLETAWRYNQEKYFWVIRDFIGYGLITEESLRKDQKFRLHLLEFSLRALRKNFGFQTFINKVRPVAEWAGIFKPGDLTLTNQHSLYSQYIQLCQEMNVSGNAEVLALFKRGPRHIDEE